MRHRHRKPTYAGWISLAALVASHAAAQAPRADTTFFVTTQGKDTVAIEYYVRSGNAITGQWIQHQGGVAVHDYTLALRDDGWPEQYVMTLYLSRPHYFLLGVTYGSDSATRIMVRDSSVVRERVVTQHAYPVGALSILATELALARARMAHVDSTSIILDRAEVHGPSPAIPVKFFGADSARIGAATLARVDRGGRLLALRNGQQETQRVSSLPVAKLVAGFIAADSAARAARVAITLPRAALQRLVGEYSLNPGVAITVALDDDKLMLHIGQQPPTRLLPLSPATFFVEDALGLTFEFESDASGNVIALTAVRGAARQRAAKTK
jgi:hypothetical protein